MRRKTNYTQFCYFSVYFGRKSEINGEYFGRIWYFLGRNCVLFWKNLVLSSVILAKLAKAYNTRYSQAVSHPSTNQARLCLVLGWETAKVLTRPDSA